MYDDEQLKAADEDVAAVVRAAFEKAERGAGIIYRNALQPESRFDLLIHVEKKDKADYYGYTDVVYTGLHGAESYLFGDHKLNVLRAMQGLSLRVVLNLTNATTGGQRLSTLVHEVGVHATRCWAGVTAFNKRTQVLKGAQEKAEVTPKDMEGVQLTLLRSDTYSAEMHHTEFGSGAAEDYNDYKGAVSGVLREWADKPFMKFAGLLGANKWQQLDEEFLAAAKKGEEGHAKAYWHPKVEYEHLLKVTAEVTKTAEDFAQRAKAGSGGGLLGFVKNFF